MIKRILLLLVLIVATNAYSSENLLTIQQQLERLQREVTDISKLIYSDKTNVEKLFDETLSKNLSAIDLRIYDIEGDLKNLNESLEEIYFTIDELSSTINQIQQTIESNVKKIEMNIQTNSNDLSSNLKEENTNSVQDSDNVSDDNSLGTLKISSNNVNQIEEESENINSNLIAENNISPEDQFQKAFDNIRLKKYNEAESALTKFIEQNPDNQLSGSAHYWLGELYVLNSDYREAALIFAEGFQKYPKSIKAGDMLHKLANTLFELEKSNEGCKTAEKFIIEFPKHKYTKKTNKLISEKKCLLND